METLQAQQLIKGPLLIDASFEEFNLNVDVSYQGELLAISQQRPTEQELLEDDMAFVRLSGFLLTKFADKISSEQKNDRLAMCISIFSIKTIAAEKSAVFNFKKVCLMGIFRQDIFRNTPNEFI